MHECRYCEREEPHRTCNQLCGTHFQHINDAWHFFSTAHNWTIQLQWLYEFKRQHILRHATVHLYPGRVHTCALAIVVTCCHNSQYSGQHITLKTPEWLGSSHMLGCVHTSQGSWQFLDISAVFSCFHHYWWRQLKDVGLSKELLWTLASVNESKHKYTTSTQFYRERPRKTPPQVHQIVLQRQIPPSEILCV